MILWFCVGMIFLRVINYCAMMMMIVRADSIMGWFWLLFIVRGGECCE